MKRFILLLLTICVCSISGYAQYQKEILVETLLKTDTTVLGQKIRYPDFKNDEITLCKVTIHPGKATGWHKHLIPVFAYVLEGTLTVEIETGSTKTYPPNSSISEVFNTFHNGINLGNEKVVLLAFYLGGKGEPLSIKKE
jgi:quercetin dioxygenase-like cupin family protein